MSIPFTRWPEEFARRYREKGYWQDLPLTDILTRHAASDSIAVIDGEWQLSYRELNQAADNLACSLRRQGIKPGETALVQLGNVAELYITFFALLKLGVAPVLALFSHQRSELNAYASQIEPALLIADRQHALFSGDDFLNTFVAEHSSIRVVQLLNDSGEHNLQDAINHPAEDFTATPSPADEVANFQLSGGTTGTPKLIPRTHTLESQPQRIVSTSVTLTGSLLAIDAPVIASGATTPNNRVADDQGFLRQWSKVAKERKLQRLYIGEPSAEAVAAQMPDLILISATGGDSALALYDQLSTIAPTLIINYDDKSWQSLLTQLGEITGHEKQAAERIALFDKQLAAAKEQIKLPPQPVTALVYTAAAHSANLWTPESAQGQMLEQLGFTLAKLPAGLNASQSQGKRHDIIQLGGENLAAGLNGESLFLFAGDQKDADAIYVMRRAINALYLVR